MWYVHTYKNRLDATVMLNIVSQQDEMNASDAIMDGANLDLYAHVRTEACCLDTTTPAPFDPSCSSPVSRTRVQPEFDDDTPF